METWVAVDCVRTVQHSKHILKVANDINNCENTADVEEW